MLRPFYAPNSCALAPHIALVEAGAEYELVWLDFYARTNASPITWWSIPTGACRR